MRFLAANAALLSLSLALVAQGAEPGHEPAEAGAVTNSLAPHASAPHESPQVLVTPSDGHDVSDRLKPGLQTTSAHATHEVLSAKASQLTNATHLQTESQRDPFLEGRSGRKDWETLF